MARRVLPLLLAALALPGAWAAASGAAPAERAAPRAVVLVTIDTLRADWVSFGGHDRATTPFLDSLAADGVVFRRAYAPSSWTSPSMASLMTGLYPTTHGVNSGTFGKKREVLNQPVLSDSFTTLAEAFRAAGFVTFGVPSNRHLSKSLGFAQGFDHYLDAEFILAPRVTQAVQRQIFQTFGRLWRQEWRARPIFLWVHFFDPHAPYHGREPWVSSFEPEFKTQRASFPAGVPWPQLLRRYPRPGLEARSRLQPLYESEIAYVDDHLREMSTTLGLDDPDVLLVVTSDHGEEFGDHGALGHGHTLYEELVRVPLLVRWPAGIAGGVDSDELVGLQDLYPTLLDLAGIEAPVTEQAASFAKVLRSGEPEASRPRFFELSSRDGVEPSLIGMIEGEWKLLRGRGSGSRAELYHLGEDPGELRDRARTDRDRARRMELELHRWVKGLEPPEKVEQLPLEDEALKRELEALGYIDGG